MCAARSELDVVSVLPKTRHELMQGAGHVLGIYTSLCQGKGSGDLERILPRDRTSFYAYGRQALAEGLRRVGITNGDPVLVPAFLCREVLASLAELGAVPRFYHVNESLVADMDSVRQAGRNGARAVLAVNYFGFPQPLGPLRDWCHAAGAALIEDNAHGFLSMDEAVPLGRRGDIGIFSMRKMLTLPNGAALVDNRSGRGFPVDESRYGVSPRPSEQRYRVKAVLKRLIALGGMPFARLALKGIRVVRQALTGAAIPPPPSDADTVVPQESFSVLTAQLLGRFDAPGEIARRRALFSWCRDRFTDFPGIQPLYSRLPEGVVPYAYPFHFLGTDRDALLTTMRRYGVICLPWPDHLPHLDCEALPHYRNLMYVTFLW